MILVLIGMSGAGKTTWANRLAEQGFACIHSDDLITTRLRDHYGIPLRDTADQGAWLGLPHMPAYAEREQLYLRCEAEVLRELAGRLPAVRGPLVIDTGGSAVYTGAALFARLRAVAHVVYLAVCGSIHQQLLNTYLSRPQPLIWDGMFQPLPGEDLRAVYTRCYPQLTSAREQLYEAYCNIRLPYTIHRQLTLTAPELLSHLAAADLALELA